MLASVCASEWIQKDSAAMLAIKRSTGVTPEVTLRKRLHAGEEACKQGLHASYETQGRRHQKSKTGVPVARQK